MLINDSVEIVKMETNFLYSLQYHLLLLQDTSRCLLLAKTRKLLFELVDEDLIYKNYDSIHFISLWSQQIAGTNFKNRTITFNLLCHIQNLILNVFSDIYKHYWRTKFGSKFSKICPNLEWRVSIITTNPIAGDVDITVSVIYLTFSF